MSQLETLLAIARETRREPSQANAVRLLEAYAAQPKVLAAYQPEYDLFRQLPEEARSGYVIRPYFDGGCTVRRKET